LRPNVEPPADGLEALADAQETQAFGSDFIDLVPDAVVDDRQGESVLLATELHQGVRSGAVFHDIPQRLLNHSKEAERDVVGQSRGYSVV
jgi:hypothetical protein